MKGSRDASAFGQADPTDGRKPYQWRSGYESEALKEIQTEARYLGGLLFGLPLLMMALWLELPKSLFHLSDEKYRPILKYGLAWASGSLGGVLFDLKWLYHSVARGRWHIDRRLWRIFTPHISGGLSFFCLALVASGALRIFDGKATNSPSVLIGLGFLVGYFSDSAIAKLTEVAETLFGTVRAKEKHSQMEEKAAGEASVPEKREDDL